MNYCGSWPMRAFWALSRFQRVVLGVVSLAISAPTTSAGDLEMKKFIVIPPVSLINLQAEVVVCRDLASPPNDVDQASMAAIWGMIELLGVHIFIAPDLAKPSRPENKPRSG